MTILTPGAGGKRSVVREHALLTKVVLIIYSCSNQYNALPIDYGIWAE